MCHTLAPPMLNPRTRMRFSSIGYARRTASSASKVSTSPAKFAGVAVAPVEVQHDGVARREFAGGLLAVGQKIGLGESLAAAVIPEVEPPAMRSRRRVGRRHDESVGLHAGIDLRHVPADYEAGRGGPRRLPAASCAARSSACRRSCLAAAISVGLKNSLYWREKRTASRKTRTSAAADCSSGARPRRQPARARLRAPRGRRRGPRSPAREWIWRRVAPRRRGRTVVEERGFSSANHYPTSRATRQRRTMLQ